MTERGDRLSDEALDGLRRWAATVLNTAVVAVIDEVQERRAAEVTALAETDAEVAWERYRLGVGRIMQELGSFQLGALKTGFIHGWTACRADAQSDAAGLEARLRGAIAAWERDTDLDVILAGLPTADGLIGRPAMLALVHLCREARDERDASLTQLAEGYKPKVSDLAKMTPDQLRLHALMAEAEIIRLRPFETDQAADAKLRAEAAEAANRDLHADIERLRAELKKALAAGTTARGDTGATE